MSTTAVAALVELRRTDVGVLCRNVARAAGGQG
jgi:hypothetical protein